MSDLYSRRFLWGEEVGAAIERSEYEPTDDFTIESADEAYHKFLSVPRVQRGKDDFYPFLTKERDEAARLIGWLMCKVKGLS